MKKILRKIVAIFTIAAVILYSLAPTLTISVNAQEATESAVTPTPSPTLENQEASSSASVEPSPEPSISPAVSPEPLPIIESSPSALPVDATALQAGDLKVSQTPPPEPPPAPTPTWTENNGIYTTQTLQIITGGLTYIVSICCYVAICFQFS